MDYLDGIVTVVAVILALVFGVVALPIAGAVLLVRFLYRKATGSDKKQLKAANGSQPYAYLEAETATQDAVIKVVDAYTDDAVLGPHAQGVLESFDAAGRYRKGIFAILEQEFDKSSLTWDKFAAPVDVALDSILANAVQIANRMQAFDSKEFQRMGRLEKAGNYKDDSVEVRRLATMRGSLQEMADIQAANDRLLGELERLQADLATMAGAGYASNTDEIVEEIRRLAEDTKYYTEL